MTEPVVLLGAGASKEAGVPLSFEMTREIVGRLNARPGHRGTQALNFVCGALMAYDSSGGADPYEGLDVERVFAAVELLARRKDLEVTPFVASWHPAVNEWDRPRPAPFWDKTLSKALLGEPHLNRGRDLIVDLVKGATSGGTGEVYRTLMGQMIGELVQLIGTTSKQVAHLAPLVGTGRPPAGVTIATLNYDLSIEQAGDAAGIPVHTGIEQWADDGRWNWPASGVRLLKMHGSIDWVWERTQPEDGQMAHTTVTQSLDAVQGTREPALIFGQGAKLRADGPFLALLAQLELQMSLTDRLVIVGYSFRDDHINEVIRRWITEDIGRHITVIDPAFPERPTSRTGFGNEMMRSLMPDTLRRDQSIEPRLTVLREPASEGLRQAFLYDA